MKNDHLYLSLTITLLSNNVIMVILLEELNPTRAAGLVGIALRVI